MIKGRLFALFAFILVSPVACAGTSDDDTWQVESSQLSNRTSEPEAALSTPAAQFEITLGSTTSNVNLGEKVDIDVIVASADTFAGTVDLRVTGLSAGVTATPVRVSLVAGPARAKLTLAAEVTANVTPRNTSVPITVVATSGAEQATAPASFQVMPNLTIYIPRDVQALYTAPGGPLRPEWGEAFGPANRPLRTQPGNPIVISIFNNDTKPHIIHGPGGSFPHGDFDRAIQPNAFEMKNGNVRTRTLKVGDSATAYIHGEPNSTNATFKVSVAATQ
jgi:hypothetical protein